MQQPLEDNEILKSISRGEHFIPGMGIFMSINDDGTHHVDAEITDRVADVSFIGMLADMTAGQTIITARAPCESATLHIEVYAVNTLVGPGTIVGRTRVLTVSKRRGVMETIFELNGKYAVAHSTFNVREGEFVTIAAPRRERQPMSLPMWQYVGAEQTPLGSQIECSPFVANHTGGLQGGVTIALAEAAALGKLAEGEALDGVSIHYMHPVIGSVATAKATRYGRSIIVNVRVDGEKKERARLTFTVA